MKYQKIAIVGLGGAGVNVLRSFQRYDSEPFSKYYTIAIAPKDRLETARTNHKIVFANDVLSQLEQAVSAFDEVYFVAGLGGSVAATFLAQAVSWAQSKGKGVVCCVTFPFEFEGKVRGQKAEETFASLTKLNAKIKIFNNQELLQKAGKDTPAIEAFQDADRELFKMITGAYPKQDATQPTKTDTPPAISAVSSEPTKQPQASNAPANSNTFVERVKFVIHWLGIISAGLLLIWGAFLVIHDNKANTKPIVDLILLASMVFLAVLSWGVSKTICYLLVGNKTLVKEDGIILSIAGAMLLASLFYFTPKVSNFSASSFLSTRIMAEMRDKLPLIPMDRKELFDLRTKCSELAESVRKQTYREQQGALLQAGGEEKDYRQISRYDEKDGKCYALITRATENGLNKYLIDAQTSQGLASTEYNFPPQGSLRVDGFVSDTLAGAPEFENNEDRMQHFVKAGDFITSKMAERP